MESKCRVLGLDKKVLIVSLDFEDDLCFAISRNSYGNNLELLSQVEGHQALRQRGNMIEATK